MTKNFTSFDQRRSFLWGFLKERDTVPTVAYIESGRVWNGNESN